MGDFQSLGNKWQAVWEYQGKAGEPDQEGWVALEGGCRQAACMRLLWVGWQPGSGGGEGSECWYQMVDCIQGYGDEEDDIKKRLKL